MADSLATFSWALGLQRLQQRDPALATLDGHAVFHTDGPGLSEAGDALEQLLLAGQALVKSDADVGLVADELRRYQKFAPAGRPPLQLVQLRRQQSSVKQAQHMARQAYIRQADAFVRALPLTVPAKLGTLATVERWLRAQLG